jgi:carbamoyltransferase
MYILGISSLAHDPAAALVDEKGIIAAMEEGKLLRTRASYGVPQQAIDFCLAKARIQSKDLGSVAIASRPLSVWPRQAMFRARKALKTPISSSYYQTKALGELARELNYLRILGGFDSNQKRSLLSFEHASCHAASAFYASPFDRALILTLDEQGDGRCGLVAVGEGTQIRELHSIRFPNSLAWVYSQVTQLLGFRKRSEEHKTQWLGITGEPVFRDLFLEVLRRGDGKTPWPRIDARFFRRGFVGEVAFANEFYRRLGLPKTVGALVDEPLRANLAASVQEACSTVVIELLEALRQESGAKSLCLAGGLFLNPLIVAAVEKKTGFDQVFVQPAAGNEGTALGAAWLAHHQVRKNPRSMPLERLDWGPSYSNQEIKQVLDNCKTSYRYMDSQDRKIEAALQLLRVGKIVAWFQGAAEFGPRALGNRSLLASPWAAYVKENLNDYVKHRESFRAFALCVRQEDCPRYFECSPAGRFMTTMAFAHSEYRKILEGFALPGNFVRLHVVERATNPLLWKLLQRFGEDSPAPLLVNTSFNLFGEPLVITPRDAVRSYFCSGTDGLIIGDFVLSKS